MHTVGSNHREKLAIRGLIGKSRAIQKVIDLTHRAAGSKASVLLLGNEAAGLAPEVVASADASVAVDHEPSVESLNVAIAGALVMFDWRRRRQALPAAASAFSSRDR